MSVALVGVALFFGARICLLLYRIEGNVQWLKNAVKSELDDRRKKRNLRQVKNV